ncbi:MAG: glycoside hydrolase family 5 protein [Spirochaetia bacterium]|nr:glycoside hydrolase family 5 protein [Spirochaetia bacterium]
MKNKLPWLKTDRTQIVTETGSPLILKGVGLGGWLLPEGYMHKLDKPYDRPRRIEELVASTCGELYAKQFWDRYVDTYITDRDIEYIHRMGFNSIRLPLNSRTLCSFDREDNPVFYEKIINKVDELLSWCDRYEVYCILDLHGAPGGQTGENIDDSEYDKPRLFMDELYQRQTIALWKALAYRYHDRSVVAGYDLLNEPLPKWHGMYNDRLMPLYRKIRDAIREVDKRHMIILEGLHWSTDWSIFEELEHESFDTNVLLEFHKYWNNPDYESIAVYKEMGERLQMPIFMGEGGENNLAWYTAAFGMFSHNAISWNFWTYKKMDCNNSLVTFPRPQSWDHTEKTKEMFDQLLINIEQYSRFLDEVAHALLRTSPLSIPAQWYDEYSSDYNRIEGAKIRSEDPISILFYDGRHADVDYCKQAGELQADEDALFVLLRPGEALYYTFHVMKDGVYTLSVEAKLEEASALACSIDSESWIQIGNSHSLHAPLEIGEHSFGIRCNKGEISLKTIEIQDGAV